MAENRTAKSCFPSRFGKGWITAAQYISELVCERRFKHEGKDVIPEFWNKPDWAKTFQYQIRLANALLKIYSDRAILNALNSKEGTSIFSLNNRFLDGIIEREAALLARLEEQPKETIKQEDVEVVIEKPRPAFAPNSQHSKLRDL